MPQAVLFQSTERFQAFRNKLESYAVPTVVLDFNDADWMDYDFNKADFVIYYPSFEFSSNSPLALQKVYDNIVFLHETYPHLLLYPDPKAVRYYNDKYRQFLFLRHNGFPIPETIPLASPAMVDRADRRLGYPMILKNRYGAGGGTVFLIHDKAELNSYYRMSQLDFIHPGALKYFASMISSRLFFWQLLKARKARFPFFSAPMLAQKYVRITRDLKTVVNEDRVVEAHWRFQADTSMWKMNIDGGGTGVWAHVPREALDVSTRLATTLQASWLNLDLIESEGRFLITEFSPVWHHYAYKEKPSFVYQDDYNIPMPLEISLDLERIIVESFLSSCEHRKKA
ncbi:MAG: ATP-grasp domain-containing protein [Thermodesulfobacteriota bacterium]